MIYISKITLTNFRCFEGVTEIELSSGINFFVGDNNAGKTTIFKAIEFIQSARNKEGWITKGLSDDAEVSVEIELVGEELSSLLENETLKKYQAYLIDDNKLIIKRSSEETIWTDSKGKKKQIKLRNIAVFNPETGIFENPTGIDNTIAALFDTQFVYSDLKNEDYQSFGKTNIAGKLLNAVTNDFKSKPEWLELEQAHEKAFGSEGIMAILEDTQKRIEDIMSDQYGDSKVEFNFGLPELENFFKNGNILLEENGIKTAASDKGTGMQRALALSLIQVYADIDKSSDTNDKPFFFFIDEPETFLHPQAQDKLIASLDKISQTSQIFLTTHSPYLLRSYNKETHKLYIFSRKKDEERIKEDTQIGLLPYSPSWGEINYFAFKVASPEFHNELFGELNNLAMGKKYNNGQGKVKERNIKSFDLWLSERKGSKGIDDLHQNKNTFTMSAYIRHYIDHPGDDSDLPANQKRSKPTIEEINNSIEFMLSVYEAEFK
ncbi:ATP-dependent nuclease [Streptococcus sobrinus]|uniref:ATP-dependent nuclease n=1 Tax=Streptococcus sobrinus TaxID=1310 RepID=UPI00031646A5|nr:AAA family ATPase [Streptococcus sobrinus]